MSTSARQQRGYSLVELLTVMAIIGVLSLVTVPAFINFGKTARLKNSLRQVSSDVRFARQRAVSTSRFVQVTVTTVSPAPGRYEIQESTDRGTTYTTVQTRELQAFNFFGAAGTLTFRPNGTLVLPPGDTTASLEVKSADTTVKNNYQIIVNMSGKVSTQ